jgi:hypothetical protein
MRATGCLSGLGDLLADARGTTTLSGLGKLLDADGDGNPLDDVLSMAGKLLGR